MASSWTSCSILIPQFKICKVSCHVHVQCLTFCHFHFLHCFVFNFFLFHVSHPDFLPVDDFNLRIIVTCVALHSSSCCLPLSAVRLLSLNWPSLSCLVMSCTFVYTGLWIFETLLVQTESKSSCCIEVWKKIPLLVSPAQCDFCICVLPPIKTRHYMHGNVNTWRPDMSVKLSVYDLFVMFLTSPYISIDFFFFGCGSPDKPIRSSV